MRLLTLALILIPSLVFGQPRFEQKHTDLLEAYAGKFGLPALDNNLAREWTENLAEQFLFTFPNESWGHKSGGPGRPPSTDVIARNCCGGIWGYDVILSQGSPSQQLIRNPETLNISGQIFIPVTAFNHLGDSGGGNPPPVPPVDLSGLQKQIDILNVQVKNLQSDVVRLESRDVQLSARDVELSQEINQLAEFTRLAVETLNAKFAELNIPIACRAGRVLGIGVSCSLVYP